MFTQSNNEQKTSQEYGNIFRYLASFQTGKNNRGYLSEWTIRHESSIVAGCAELEMNPQEELVHIQALVVWR